MLKLNGSKKNKIILSLMLIVALAGGLLFFPLQLQDSYTCLFHRVFDGDNPASAQQLHPVDQLSGGHEMSTMLTSYLHRYAFLWWGSLALAAFSIYRMHRQKKTKSNYYKEEYGGMN